MERNSQFNDLAQCDSVDDCVTYSFVQEEMLQNHTWMADTVLTHAAVLVLLFVYRVSIYTYL